jgi:arylsulfatase A-like enzyme
MDHPRQLGSRRVFATHRAVWVAALVLLAVCGCHREPLHPRHLFLITVDTLRADHLGTYGYVRDTSPAVDELAAGGVLFERAIAQWPKTGPSFASLFTGQYPLSTGLTHKADVRIPAGFLTLPEFLHGRGFTTVAVNSNGVLSVELGWNQGFDEYLETQAFFSFDPDDPASYRDSMNARRVNELALPLLARHRHAERLFAWIHYSDPHTPYLLPRAYENPFLGDSHFAGDRQVRLENPKAAEIDGRRDLKFYVAQYDANIRVVDASVGELLAEIRRLGLADDAAFVFTADHGESLGEHESYLEHGRLPYNTTAHVPLVVLEPYRQAAARRIRRPVELVDLYPTLRDLVAPGAEVAGLEGRSLAAFLRGRGEAEAEQAGAFLHAFSQAGGGSPLTHFRSVQERRWKLVFHPPRPTRKAEEGARWELYDLERDPLEARDLAAVHPDQVRRLMPLLEGWMDGRLWIQPPKGLASRRSEETMKALRALGYVD